jgi:hypothetical protein
VVNSFLEKKQQALKMTMPPGAVQDGVPPRVLGIHIRAVLDQQAHDFGIAVSGCVVDWLVAAAVGRCCQVWMPC